MVEIQTLKKKYMEFGGERGYWNTGKGVWFYLEHELFPKIDFDNKNFLDIGAGKGIFSAYAAIKGAKEVVGLEPELEGSSENMTQNFNDLIKTLNFENVFLKQITLQEYVPELKFDIVLMHNSINHLDEEKCKILHENLDARESYLRIFKNLRKMMNDNGKLIITDCARGNLSTKIGLKRGTKYNHTIEWEKHQDPELWTQLLETSGFKLLKKSYKGESRYMIFSYLFKNKLMAYLRWNDFIMTFKAV